MSVTDKVLPDAHQAKLFKTHVQGAIIRSIASLIMWLFALFAFWVDDIRFSHFTGISCSVLFLVLINPPTLFIIKRITRNKVYANISLSINILETLGYTAIIFSLGGLEATYLTPIYAVLIAYLGIMAPRKVPFIVASFCAIAFGSMVALDGLGIISSHKVDPNFNPSLTTQFIRVSVVIGLLFIVAYTSSFTAGKLKQGRDRLRRQNRELENALKEIQTLREILPLCSFCKKIRDDEGYWEQVDVYIQKHLQADISHSVCPKCAEEHYPDWVRSKKIGSSRS